MGKADLAYPSVLAGYAVKQFQDGRRVGSAQNSRDVLSPRVQRIQGFQVERLDRFDSEEKEWHEAVAVDHRRPVSAQAAFRCDFPVWLNRRSPRDRKLVRFLGRGESTQDAARHFGVSSSRISQLRRELADSWALFHGEPATF